MNNYRCILYILLLCHTSSIAQDRFFSKTATISFFSKTDVENIEAVNTIVTIVLDTKSAAVQLSVPMKAFAFERALMQEHFNENYVESEKYPTSTFKGTITNNSTINYKKPGSYEAIVEGQLTIHGVTRQIQTRGTITVDQQALRLSTTFNVLIADYKITVPALVADKISKTVKISMQAKLDPLTR